MHKIISLLGIMLLIGQFSIAQNYKKAFKALENKEYTNARVQFAQAQKDPTTKAIGDYGIAVIQRLTSMRIEDLYSAYKNITSSKLNWSKCTENVRDKNKDFITEEIINTEFKNIEGQLFEKVKADGSSQAWEKFLTECPLSSHQTEARNFLNEAAYNKAMSFNTIPVWKDFIKQYPDTEQAKKAQNNIYSLAWNEISLRPNIENLESYISQYPQANNIEYVKNELLNIEYKRALAVNTDAAFASFIAKYPDSEQAKNLQSKAIENDYQNAIKFKEISLCDKFIVNYPNSKYVSEILEMKDSLEFIKTLKLNTPKAYEEFIINFPNSKQVPLAMSKMGNLIYSKEELKNLAQKTRIKNINLKSLSAFEVNTADTSIKVLSEEKRFDVFGNCIYSFNSVTPELKEVYKNSYDDAGDKLLKSQYFVNDKIKTISYYIYNIKGQAVNAQIVCNFDCRDTTANYSDTMIYDTSRNLLEKISRNAFGKIVEKHKYTYDDRGNKVLDKYSVLTNDSIHSFYTKYDYDGKGMLLQQTQKDELGTIISIGSYSYDGLSRMISSSYYDKIGTIYKTYFYDKNGFVNNVIIKNEENNGKENLKIYQYKFQ